MQEKRRKKKKERRAIVDLFNGVSTLYGLFNPNS